MAHNSSNSEHRLLHFGTSNLWMLFIHSMRSATSILRQLHTPEESSVKHPFLPEPRFCLLVERFPRIFLSLSTRICVFFNFILISFLMGISPSPSYQPRVIVESTQREQQMQAEYQLWSGPGDTSWKEGHLCGSRNYITVEGGCKHSVYPLFLYCSVFPFALRDCLGHLQHLNFNCHLMISSTFA